ncbi:carbonic anhydrase 1 [Drosophila virilis]|uniref:Alpha-carbonic anhydrase domain-containing protein n=1 Tax=Drosophila virilis TaxID=7244 RepID=B4ME63_DROVI|nr:carbonic anhydrase 1 [Drosophila virilis]EDW58828.1 uncharacterized protein Dvir_GJ17447 [Drosophila virilis]
MGCCWSCACVSSYWCWLREQSVQLLDTNWFIWIWAVSGALIVLYNLHSGICLMEHISDCGQAGEESAAAAAAAPDTSSSLDYGIRRGPHTWRTADNNQSPINIVSRSTEEVCFSQALRWIGYDDLPVGIRLENNGHTLLLRAAFQDEETPHLGGGDLLSCFSFHEISFRWSWYNSTGSEHTLDNEHFPLEMQCLHTDAANTENASSRSLLMVSYMFAVSAENPFMDVIVQHLVAVQLAGQCVEIPPFPLNYLMSPFYTDFYSYHGSLTEPPCHRGAEWFIYPQPIAISERQLHEFRKLRSRSGARIGRNARPVQSLGDRTVKINCYRASE